ncbi:MAG TPA: type II CAAX endopeptidase family protein [Bacillales bacterium]|nr:type II CAAX endopeptidase family protein [Bacillales bacterium]
MGVTTFITFTLMYFSGSIHIIPIESPDYLAWYLREAPVVLCFFGVLTFFKSVRHYIFSSFSLYPFKRFRTYVYIFLGLIAIYIIPNHLFHLDLKLTWIRLTSHFSAYPYVPNWQPIVYLISVCVLIPIYEEALFRGLLFRFFAEKYNIWISLIGTSLIFGSFHTGYVLYAAFMGAVFAGIYQLTKSLVPAMVCHGLFSLFVQIESHDVSIWQFLGGAVFQY